MKPSASSLLLATLAISSSSTSLAAPATGDAIDSLSSLPSSRSFSSTLEEEPFMSMEARGMSMHDLGIRDLEDVHDIARRDLIGGLLGVLNPVLAPLCPTLGDVFKLVHSLLGVDVCGPAAASLSAEDLVGPVQRLSDDELRQLDGAMKTIMQEAIKTGAADAPPSVGAREVEDGQDGKPGEEDGHDGHDGLDHDSDDDDVDSAAVPDPKKKKPAPPSPPPNSPDLPGPLKGKKPPVDPPIDKVPVDKLPVDKVPVDKLPVNKESAPAPVDKLPTDKVPVDKLPVDKVPVDKLPTDKLPTDKLPTDKLPTDKLPVKPRPPTGDKHDTPAHRRGYSSGEDSASHLLYRSSLTSDAAGTSDSKNEEPYQKRAMPMPPPMRRTKASMGWSYHRRSQQDSKIMDNAPPLFAHVPVATKPDFVA